jgi:ABC-2 type transport system ATP-binding protein
MTPAISMSGVTKRYRSVTALGDLTLDVPAGSIFGFLGANGAGKTTALKILAGLTRATAGSAAVNGIAVDVQGTHRARIGYLAQDPQFYGWMTGRQTLEYVAGFFMPRATGGRIDELLDLVGIADAANRRTSTYSGGMRQRLGMPRPWSVIRPYSSSTSRPRRSIRSAGTTCSDSWSACAARRRSSTRRTSSTTSSA